MRLRTGLVGCGKVSHLHAPALRELSKFVGVCDVDRERASLFAAQYGARAFDFDGLLRCIDVLVVCTPHPRHASAAIAAARAGVHVLVEKPLASTVPDCDAMIEAASSAGVLLGVVSQRRFFEPVVRMKAAIDAGKIGTPVLGTVSMFSWRDEAYYRSDPWRGRWDTEGGGVLINQSPHHIDILQWLMGPVEEVVGRWANLNHPYIEVEDTAVAILRFASGGLATITVSVSQKPGIYTKIHIHGSNGASVGAQTDTGATFVAGMSGVVEPAFNDVWTIQDEEHVLRMQDPAGTDYHRLQIEDFLTAVRYKRPPAVPGEEGRKVVAIIEAIYGSAPHFTPSASSRPT